MQCTSALFEANLCDCSLAGYRRTYIRLNKRKCLKVWGCLFMSEKGVDQTIQFIHLLIIGNNMLKKSLLILSLLSSFVYSGGALAARTSHVGIITNIYSISSGSVVIYLDSSSAKCITSGGAATNRFYLRIDKGVAPVTESAYKNIYSSALAAFTAGKRARLYFNDETTTCDVDRILLYKD